MDGTIHYGGPGAVLVRLLDHCRDVFHLIGGDEIGARAYRRLPARHHFFFRAEVVVLVPTLILGFGVTVQGVDSDQIPHAVAVIHELLHALFRTGGPAAGAA